MKKLPAQYDHKEAEGRLQLYWETNGIYRWDESQPRENTFVIDTPPPTVSGVLHMGHIFSYTQADFMARYQRMKGKTVFYPMGFDDNGLPTERLVEKEKKVRGKDMPRDAFVALCREVVQSAEEEFRKLFKSAALSIDWSQEYQTISDDVRKISQESFLDLLAKGEAYRDFRPTYWDWVDQTAIAQAEIENREMPGVMNEIAFALEDGTPLVIATTRPELLGACVAVMYHPEDANAAKYEGKYAITPLFGVKVPMIADELVERDKGTGLVMCCTFGDDTDKEWWRKHQLPTRPIIYTDGKINVSGNNTDGDPIWFGAGKDGSKVYSKSALYQENCANLKKAGVIFLELEGLKPKQAQIKIIELLQAESLLLNQIPITHTVKCAERSGTPIEIIPTYQWFIKVTDKKEALLAKGNECNWYPEFMHIRLNQWIEGLKEDWCISRQRFFGVPFPVWYSKRQGEEGKIIVPDASKLPVDPLYDLPEGYTRDEVTGSSDIMDTWATSSLSPQINARAVSLTPTLSRREREFKPSPSWRGLGEGKANKKSALSAEFLSRVRELRVNTTNAEQYMWSVLRDRQLSGFKFRRQHPIPPYIADFFCHEANLVIELDGGQHNEAFIQKKDNARTAFLESKGYKVLRFWNNEVLQNMEGVYQHITDVLQDGKTSPHPDPLPQGEGEEKPSPSGRGVSEGNSLRYQKLFPADLRPQAHEIIRTWAFYTIVKAHLHGDSIPWKNLMISGWCLASDKTKMSKSKGNVVTPVDLIMEKGADAVRYWASTSRLGADTAFSEDLLKIGRKLVNKLWNASSFVALHLEKITARPINATEDVQAGRITETLDKWILSRLHQTVQKATEEFDRFEYSDARVAIEEFFWKDFCDNYLELVKIRAYGEDAAAASAHLTLYHCLNAILRLFAPFVPHITEEIYLHLFNSQHSVHLRGNWLKIEDYPREEAAEQSGIHAVTLLEAIRKAKSEKQVSIKFPISQLVIVPVNENTVHSVKSVLADLKAAGNVDTIIVQDEVKTGMITTDDGAFYLQLTFAETK